MERADVLARAVFDSLVGVTRAIGGILQSMGEFSGSLCRTGFP